MAEAPDPTAAGGRRDRLPHRITLRVYYEDTDMAGLVYHANHLRFLERGRSEALRAAGIDQGAMAAEGRHFVVARLAIGYRRPARYDDLLTVETALRALRGASAVLDQRILRGAGAGGGREAETVAEAEVAVALAGPSGRPERFPPDLRAALARLSPQG